MIVFSQQEAIENQLAYHKNCFICNREYWSSSRNSKYCCEECSAKSLVKINKRNKTRRIRRKAYAENQEINRALSKAYALAHEVMALYKVPKTCSCHEFGYEDECSGAIELHHKDGNPFNNAPWNLAYMCRHHHAKADDEHAEVNMVDTYNEAIDEAGFEEEDQKHKIMIQYTKLKIEGECNE